MSFIFQPFTNISAISLDQLFLINNYSFLKIQQVQKPGKHLYSWFKPVGNENVISKWCPWAFAGKSIPLIVHHQALTVRAWTFWLYST